MDRILIILKKENGPRASAALTLGLNTIILKHVYWYMYMQQISGERLQDHWSSGFNFTGIYAGEFGSRVCREIKCTNLCLFAINSLLNNISVPQKQ